MEKRLHQDDAKPEMEAVKHFLSLNPDRSSLFFANHVLLVEGPTEVALVNRLVGDGKIKNADCGLYVLDCLGKYNIHRFMNLLGHLGVPLLSYLTTTMARRNMVSLTSSLKTRSKRR